MSLEKTIEADFIAAMKARDAQKVSALRLLKAAIANDKIQKKKALLDDVEIQSLVQKQIKQRQESFEAFQKGGRPDLAQREEKEMDILAAYLPEQLSDDQIKKLAQAIIHTTGAKSLSDIGKVMKELMPQIKGKADGRRVNEILAALLNPR